MACESCSKIDLHIHSSASDGSLTPAEILDMALSLNLGAIAITDHDTVEGSRNALAIGIPSSLKFLSGVEISAGPPPEYPIHGSLHILGYGFEPDDPDLNRLLEKLQVARNERNPRIIQKLNDLGIALSLDDVRREAKDSQLGRPHIATGLVKKGVVSSYEEAFVRYLGNGKPAYVDKYRVPCQEAIHAIRSAGGLAVLAHPGLIRELDPPSLELLVTALVPMGLGGIEVFYPQHHASTTAQLANLARQTGLLQTGGSDFHGNINPDVRMGTGRGNLNVPYSIYENIVASLP